MAKPPKRQQFSSTYDSPEEGEASEISEEEKEYLQNKQYKKRTEKKKKLAKEDPVEKDENLSNDEPAFQLPVQDDASRAAEATTIAPMEEGEVDDE